MRSRCSPNGWGASVADISIKYYVVTGGRGYWRPSKKLRDLGFMDVTCGVDSPGAWEIAIRCNRRVAAALNGEEPAPNCAALATREQAEVARAYPSGSVGAAFQRYIRTDEWAKKGLGTRNKVWWRAWYRIREMWGDVAPDSITFEQMSAWRSALEKQKSLDTAHKTIKIWRALWPVMKAMKIARGDDPSLAVVNNAPRPRNERWNEGEAVRLAKCAWREGYKGLACIIAVAWDSTFSPVDVRTLRRRQMKQSRRGVYFDRTLEGRQKTGRAAVGTVSKRTQALVALYLVDRQIELHDQAFLFYTKSGTHYREDMLAHDFAKVRAMVFPGDRRRLADMRRSGAVEVIAGDAKPGTLSAKMANSIETSNTLHKTYSPVDLASVRLADEARKRGRRRIRDENA